MTEPLEYDCEGCGIHVYAIGIATVPTHNFCAQCAWLCEHCPDPLVMESVRDATDAFRLTRKDLRKCDAPGCRILGPHAHIPDDPAPFRRLTTHIPMYCIMCGAHPCQCPPMTQLGQWLSGGL